MKRLLLTLTVVAVSALTMYGQGRINWNNFTGGAVTIGTDPQSGPSGGNTGDFVGSTYSVQLLWAAGTFADQAAFDAASPSSSPIVSFFGGTGNAPTHGPTVDGAGLYDGGSVVLGPAAGVFTLQTRAWWNTGFASYAAAATGGRNVGQSALTQITATAAPTPAPDSVIPAFTVQPIPEPATLALAGLGIASLLLFRRRK